MKYVYKELNNDFRDLATKDDYRKMIEMCEKFKRLAKTALNNVEVIEKDRNRYSFSGYPLYDVLKGLRMFIEEIDADLKSLKSDINYLFK